MSEKNLDDYLNESKENGAQIQENNQVEVNTENVEADTAQIPLITDSETDEDDARQPKKTVRYQTIDEDYTEDETEDDYDYSKPRVRRRRKNGAAKMFTGILVIVTIITASAILAYYIISGAQDFLGIGKSNIEIPVVIPEDATTTDISQILYNEGIVNYPNLFKFYSRISKADENYQPGDFTIKKSMSYSEIITVLQEIDTTKQVVRITIPEGYSSDTVTALLLEKGALNEEDVDTFKGLYKNLQKGYLFQEYLSENPLKFYQMEGYLFPDTYDFYVGEDPETAIKRFYTNFNNKITDNIYSQIDGMGMTLNEVITLASLVQAEAHTPETMQIVSSVFMNRLNAAGEYPLLQSDPTKKYVNETILKSLFENEIGLYEEVIKAYNTYEGTGLPPGPICNPGMDAINAVLNPAETNYYYFCNNIDTREYFFAETLAEHEQNLIKAGINLE